MPPTAAAFQATFGRPPRWLASAPGRVNLIGEHTDYNGGFVLPMAIDRETRIAAAPNGSDSITVRSTAFDDVVRIDLEAPVEPEPKCRWGNYLRGVVAGFRNADIALQGFDALVDSTVPLGAGLSSSASLEVAFATLLEGATGRRLEPLAKVDLCRDAEHRYARVPCGIMDQFACALSREGQVMLLDCLTQEPEWIPFDYPGVCVLIVQTGVRHQLAASEYAVRREQCETAARAMGVRFLREATVDQLDAARERLGETNFRRARHVVTENDRTRCAARAIGDRDWAGVGEFMRASHRSLRDDFEVSCKELDAVVDIADGIGAAGGVYGCRMTGGGFGGCAVALIRSDAQGAVSRVIEADYKDRTGLAATVFASRPMQGARFE
jgi:galactokinase